MGGAGRNGGAGGVGDHSRIGKWAIDGCPREEKPFVGAMALLMCT